MCRFIVCIVYIHRYTSFLTEAALTKAVSTKAGSSRKQNLQKFAVILLYQQIKPSLLLNKTFSSYSYVSSH